MFDEMEEYQRQAQSYHELGDRFSQYLMDGEDILWQGGSHRTGIMAVDDPVMKIGGIVALVFMIFWTVSTLSSGWIMGYMGFFGLFVCIKQLFIGNGKKYYAITNKRVLTLSKKGVNSDHLTKIDNLRIVKKKNGMGSILYGAGGLMIYARNDSLNSSGRPIEGGIYGIDAPEEVYRILNEAVYAAQNPKK